MEVKAEAHILNGEGKEIIIEKTFSDYKAAEAWVARMFNNERCFLAGCPTLGMARIAE